MSRPGARLRRWEPGLLAAILLLAGALRLGAPGITEFKRDEANLSRLALDLAQGKDFPLLGISSSVGIPNPPISVYLFALPYALDSTPILATLFVGALGTLAVALTWLLVRRTFGPRAALIAALLYAASPWGAVFARKIWAQDLLPPFVVGTVLLGAAGYGERRRWAQALHWPLLALTIQMHYAAVTLLPLSLLMLVLWRRNARWRAVVVGLALAGLTLVPALIGAARADLLALDTLARGLGGSGAGADALSTRALELAWLTVAGTDLHALAGPERFRDFLRTVPDVDPLLWLVPLAAALTALWLVGRAARRGVGREPAAVVLVAWLALPALAFTWEWTEVAQHYLIPLLPAAYALAGIGLAALLDRLPQRPAGHALRAGLLGAVVAIVALQVYLFVALLRFLDTHDTPGGFGTPLGDLLDIRAAVLARDPADVIVIGTGEIAPYDEEPAVWGVLLDPAPSLRFVDGRRTAVIPAQPATELIAVRPDLRACAARACFGQAAGEMVFEPRPGGPCYLVRQTDADPWAVTVTPIEPVRFANGAALTGYAIRPGEVLLRYRLPGPVAADFQVFVHALDEAGARLAQADRPGWPGRYWRAGDTLTLWFALDVPDGADRLLAGMYAVEDGAYRNVEVLDAQGAYLAQAAEIPLGEG